MKKDEILDTRIGEMLDMIACEAISSGNAEQINTKKLSFAEAMNLR